MQQQQFSNSRGSRLPKSCILVLYTPAKTCFRSVLSRSGLPVPSFTCHDSRSLVITSAAPSKLPPVDVPDIHNTTFLPTSHDSSSRSLVIASAARRPGAPRTVPDNFDFLPTSLEAAKQELAALAAPGTSWAPQAQPIEAAAQSLGGHFFLVSCGQYLEDHPLAGKPAYALLQLVFCSCCSTVEDSPYFLKKTPVCFQHSKDCPQDLTLPLVYFIAYEVDGNGWPTGAAYNSATAFEQLTTRKTASKVLNSFSIIHQGRQLTLLMHYYKKLRAQLGVEVPPPSLVRVVGSWARDQLEAVGVTVMHKYKLQFARSQLAGNKAEQLAREGLGQEGTTDATSSPSAAPAVDAARPSEDDPPQPATRRRQTTK